MSEPFVPTWRDNALCREVDPEIWFVAKGGSARPAKRICAACPVRVACLDYALRHNEAFGIWGGLTEKERKALRKQRVERLAPVVDLPIPSVPERKAA